MDRIANQASAAIALAGRPPLRLADTAIDPSTREIKGPEGRVVVEPRVMRLLLILADAGSGVVTRDAIADQCWAGRFVADDTLNNAVAELRRALRTAAGSALRVETVPKTGYRLLVEGVEPTKGGDLATQEAPGTPTISRRLLLAGGVAAVAGAGAIGWNRLTAPNREAMLLIEQGAQSLRWGLPESGPQAVRSIRAALALEPDSAKAWGMLAIALRASAEYGDAVTAERAIAEAELAARRALAIDRDQSDALAALAMLTPAFGQWAEAEQRLRQVLAVDPTNPYANAALGTLLMSTGQVAACLERLQWLYRNTPPSPNLQFRRVYTLWSVGRLTEADRVADMALQAWPRHAGVWFARLWTLAFTGRPAAARLMVEDQASRPTLPPPVLALLGASLKALETRSPADVAPVIAGHLAAAPRGPSQSISAIMMLSQLGEPRAALDVAMAYLAGRGPLVVKARHSANQPSLPDQHHRMSMMLWIPATLALRLEPGFRQLCEAIQLVSYWQTTGKRPDFRQGSLASL